MSDPVIIRELEFDAAKKLEAAGCVFIVHEEWEEGGDGGHSIIIGVYATVEEAFASHDDSVRQAKSMGKIVWANADEDEDEGEWDVDVHIDALQMKGVSLLQKAAEDAATVIEEMLNDWPTKELHTDPRALVARLKALVEGVTCG